MAKQEQVKGIFASAEVYLQACKENPILKIYLEEIISLANKRGYDSQFNYPNIELEANKKRLIKSGVIEESNYKFKIRTTNKTNKWLEKNGYLLPQEKVSQPIINSPTTEVIKEAPKEDEKSESILAKVKKGDVLIRQLKKDEVITLSALVVEAPLSDGVLVVSDRIQGRTIRLKSDSFNREDIEFPKLTPYKVDEWKGREDEIVGLKEALNLDNLEEAHVTVSAVAAEVNNKNQPPKEDKESGSLGDLSFCERKERAALKLALEAQLWRAIRDGRSIGEKIRDIVDKSPTQLELKIKALPPSSGELEEEKLRLILNPIPKLILLIASDGNKIAAAEIGIYKDGSRRIWREPDENGNAFYDITHYDIQEYYKSGGRLEFVVKKSEIQKLIDENVTGIEAALRMCRIEMPKEKSRVGTAKIQKPRILKEKKPKPEPRPKVVLVKEKKPKTIKLKEAKLSDFDKRIISSIGEVGLLITDSAIRANVDKLPDPFIGNPKEIEEKYSIQAQGLIQKLKALKNGDAKSEVTLLHGLINPTEGLSIYEREKIIECLPSLKLTEVAEIMCKIGLNRSITKEELKITPEKDLGEFWGERKVGTIKLSLLRVWQSKRDEFSSSLWEFAKEFNIKNEDLKNFVSRDPGLNVFKDLPIHIPYGKYPLSMLLRAAEAIREFPHDVVQFHAIFKFLELDPGIAKRWLDDNPEKVKILESRGIFPSIFHTRAITPEITEWYKRLGMEVTQRAWEILVNGKA